MRQSAVQEDWDFAWDYMSGLTPDEAGMEKILSDEDWGKIHASMTDAGYEMVSTTPATYVRLEPSVKTMQTGVVQVTVIIQKITNMSENGLRILLSNGTDGLQIRVYYGGIYVDIKGVMQKLLDVETGREYTFELHLNDNGKNAVLVDGIIILETSDMSTSYCTANRIFQQGGGASILKSIKYKFGRV